MKLSKSEAGRLGAAKSRLITAANYQKRLEIYRGSPKLCEGCSKPIEYVKRQNKFCNHSCAAKYTNVQRAGYKASAINKNLQCFNCKKKTSSNRNKYCSHRCQQSFQHKAWVQRWLAGQEDGIVSSGMSTSASIKRWLVESYGEKCVLCGWDEANPHSGRRPLNIDHVDGNSVNNRPENVRLLCPNCHSLTSTFGILNKGNGRAIRRQRRKTDKIKYC